jgi:outer membrane protein assembly factor BamD
MAMGMMRAAKLRRTTTITAVALAMAVALAGCGGKMGLGGKSAKNKLPSLNDSAAPDKTLYERAMGDIQHKKYETARLELNALINTYPETEYLAKAKLAIADSFYKESGTGNLAQAVAQYKDFITFFPFLPEASYAQMQVAMTHFRQLAKPDRDRTEAELAEQEFQIFLKNYPDNELAPVAAQHLREVQEMLAEGDFRIANFYYMRQLNRAAAGRLQDIANRYPLFSKADEVLWMLGTISENAPTGNLAGKEKEAFLARRKETAIHYYSELVTDYPLSNLVPKTKDQLTKLGAPIPQPDAAALARMQQEKDVARNHPSPVRHVTGVIHSGPDVSMAARVGTPNLNPPDNNGGGGETLNAALTNMNVTGGTTTPANAGGRVEGGEGSAIQPGAGSSVQPPVQPGKVGTPGSNPPAGESSSARPPSTTSANPPPPAGASTNGTANGTGSTANPATNPPTDAQANPCGPDNKNGKQDSSSSKSNDKNKKKPDCDPNKKNESSSKKKTGIHKIIPW